MLGGKKLAPPFDKDFLADRMIIEDRNRVSCFPR